MIVCVGTVSSLRRCFVSGIGLLYLLYSVGAWAQASEAGLRAAFLYNFFKFIEWPDLQKDELLLCALSARDSLRDSLIEVENKQAHRYVIKVRFLDDEENLARTLTQCHLLYMPVTGADMQLPVAIPEGTLLVADEPDPEDTRVGIALIRTRQDRIEFTVNEVAIKHAGVKVSSQLLKLARSKPGGAS